MKRAAVLVVVLTSASVALGSIVLSDNFNSKGTVPASLFQGDNSSPDVGANNWDSGSANATNNSDLVWLQNNIAQSGNALELTRVYVGTPGDGGAWRTPLARLYDTTNPTNFILPGGMTIFKTDYFVNDANSDGTISLQINGYGTEVGPRLWLRNAGSFLTAGVYSNVNSTAYWTPSTYRVGTGGWVTVEMVVHWAEESGGTINGRYDVYLTRDANNSQGQLARTLILEDLELRDNLFTTARDHRIQLANQPGSILAADGLSTITYWDNISLSVIPEPGTVIILAGGLLLLFRLRRRQLT